MQLRDLVPLEGLEPAAHPEGEEAEDDDQPCGKSIGLVAASIPVTTTPKASPAVIAIARCSRSPQAAAMYADMITPSTIGSAATSADAASSSTTATTVPAGNRLPQSVRSTGQARSRGTARG